MVQEFLCWLCHKFLLVTAPVLLFEGDYSFGSTRLFWKRSGESAQLSRFDECPYPLGATLIVERVVEEVKHSTCHCKWSSPGVLFLGPLGIGLILGDNSLLVLESDAARCHSYGIQFADGRSASVEYLSSGLFHVQLLALACEGENLCHERLVLGPGARDAGVVMFNSL